MPQIPPASTGCARTGKDFIEKKKMSRRLEEWWLTALPDDVVANIAQWAVVEVLAICKRTQRLVERYVEVDALVFAPALECTAPGLSAALAVLDEGEGPLIRVARRFRLGGARNTLKAVRVARRAWAKQQRARAPPGSTWHEDAPLAVLLHEAVRGLLMADDHDDPYGVFLEILRDYGDLLRARGMPPPPDDVDSTWQDLATDTLGEYFDFPRTRRSVAFLLAVVGRLDSFGAYYTLLGRLRPLLENRQVAILAYEAGLTFDHSILRAEGFPYSYDD